MFDKLCISSIFAKAAFTGRATPSMDQAFEVFETRGGSKFIRQAVPYLSCLISERSLPKCTGINTAWIITKRIFCNFELNMILNISSCQIIQVFKNFLHGYNSVNMRSRKNCLLKEIFIGTVKIILNSFQCSILDIFSSFIVLFLNKSAILTDSN